MGKLFHYALFESFAYNNVYYSTCDRVIFNYLISTLCVERGQWIMTFVSSNLLLILLLLIESLSLSGSVLPRYIAPIEDHRQSCILFNCSNFASIWFLFFSRSALSPLLHRNCRTKMLLSKIYFLPSCYALYFASREVLSIIRDDDDRYFYSVNVLLFNFIFIII